MAEFAALPLFTDSWIADTAHLRRAERGLYFDLLVLMWRTPECRVPNEIEWIMRRLQCADDERETLVSIIGEFCASDGNWITQKRLQKEFNYVRSKSRKQSVRAKSRWNKDKAVSRGNAALHGSGNAPTPTPTEDDDVDKRARDFDTFDAALRAIPGIASHPVAVAPVIAPIWQQHLAGFDLKTQIIPSIARQVAAARRPISAWGYFVSGIIADARPPPPPIPGPPANLNGNHANGTTQVQPALSPRQAHIAKLKQRAVDAKLREIGEGGNRGGPDIPGEAGIPDGKPGLPGRPH